MSLLSIDDGTGVAEVTVAKKLVEQRRLAVGTQAEFLLKISPVTQNGEVRPAFEAAGCVASVNLWSCVTTELTKFFFFSYSFLPLIQLRCEG